MNNSAKIVILGCGFSGMITALALARIGIASIILDQEKIDCATHSNHDIRTTAITHGSRQFFQEIAIWEQMASIAGPINDIYVVNNKSDDMIHFVSQESEADVNEEKMGYILRNDLFKKALLEYTQKEPLITIYDNCQYSLLDNNQQGCVLDIKNPSMQLECNLLILCNGNQSALKDQYFHSSLTKNYQQYALTFLAWHEKEHEGTAIEHFLPSGPFAILPLIEQHLSSVVWTVPARVKNSLLNLPSETFLQMVQENFGPFLGQVQLRSHIAAFALKCNIVDDYFNKSMLVIADSAHVIHPLAGQGLNQGIKDIKSLQANLMRHGVTKHMLEQYQAERKFDNMLMLYATDGINSIFSNSSYILHQARHCGFKLIEQISPFKKLLMNYASGR